MAAITMSTLDTSKLCSTIKLTAITKKHGRQNKAHKTIEKKLEEISLARAQAGGIHQ
jgi:hypothetical protein